ncbi:hypothetical protein Tco_1578530 [Tanacetum coccineum]
MKSQLSLKEVEAAEAIRLRGRVATIEAAEALHAAELNLLKERNSTLEAKMLSSLKTTCAKLHNQIAGYELFKEQIEAVQDEQVKVLTEKITEVDANLMEMALQLDDERDYSDVAVCNPSVDADYVAVVSALCDVDFSLLTLLASQKDASIANIMDSLRLEGPASEIPDAGEGDAEALNLSLSNAMVPLIEPLSSKNYVSILVLPLSVADHRVIHVGLQVEDPTSNGIVFEKEELETSPEPAANILTTACFRYFIWSFPLRAKIFALFCMAGLIDPVHKISKFEVCVADLRIVIFFYFSLLFASRIATCSLLSLKRSRFISKASSFCTMSTSNVLMIGMPILAGIIAFVLYVSENGVSPLLDLIMVRCAYRTCGSSSIQSLLLSSSYAFIPSHKLLFALSTKPLACGCLTEAKHWRMDNFSHQSLNGLSLNYFPLSDIISLRRPNLQTILSHTNFLT